MAKSNAGGTFGFTMPTLAIASSVLRADSRIGLINGRMLVTWLIRIAGQVHHAPYPGLTREDETKATKVKVRMGNHDTPQQAPWSS